MGVVPKPETKRNKKLAKDYLKKDDDGNWLYTVSQLGLKYARKDDQGNSIPLTSGRIYQILAKLDVPKNRK